MFKKISNYLPPKTYKPLIFTGILALVLVLIFALTAFTGEINYEFKNDSLTVNASYHKSLEIKYSEIDSIEFRVNSDVGKRDGAFVSDKLLLGNFESERYGEYIRYSYKNNSSSIIIKTKNKTIILNDKTDSETKELYSEILNWMPKK